jgi:acyl-CoA reductase-like NAD-dependent aldehyde dehydrogenase
MSDYSLVINGERVSTPESFGVINPSTGDVFDRAPSCTPELLDAAMEGAGRAFAAWKTGEDVRRDAMREAALVLERAADRMATVLTLEQGKPLKDSLVEVAVACTWLRYYADLDVQRDVVKDDDQEVIELLRRPLGVVAAITPWNFPISLAMWKIAPALRAGNTVVLKPSPFTPLATLMMGEILQEVLPPGVLNVITGSDPLGASMTAHRVPRKVSFTGSTATGKRVAISAAQDLKRVTLELGGNDPAILLEDADPATIADKLFWSALGNNGQICLAVKRVYAHERIYDEVVEALAERARSVQVGDGFRDGTELGPLNNRPQYERVKELVNGAVADGAKVAAGGKPMEGSGYFFEPTILGGLGDGSRIVDEEQFGPALPVIPYRDVTAVLETANSGHYGLTGSVWSADVEHAFAVASELDCGQVSINVHGGGVRPELPFGGHKWSGIGVENGLAGLFGFTDTKVIVRPK